MCGSASQNPPFSQGIPFLRSCCCFLSLVLPLVLARVLVPAQARTWLRTNPRLPIKGPILDVTKELEWVDKIALEDNIRGVVLRVDSPGGGAAASQELYSALKRLAKSKPIVVSMGSTAASGGLMVSMAGERIFANASTVTGSIGVRMDIPQVQKLMETIGIG